MKTVTLDIEYNDVVKVRFGNATFKLVAATPNQALKYQGLAASVITAELDGPLSSQMPIIVLVDGRFEE